MAKPLLAVKRGEEVESLHFGSIAVVDGEGKLLYSLGDVERITFARSMIKPVQAIPLVETGAADHFSFTDKEIALCCASHRGEKQHTETVIHMLHKLGLGVADLQCGAHPPYNVESYEGLLREGGKYTAIHNNCSGKHTGLLATALHLESDPTTYYQPDHPVQRKIVAALALLSDVAAEQIKTGVDGCGVPTFALPLEKLALVFSRLASPERVPEATTSSALKRIVAAMVHYPEMVGGTDVFDTDLMRAYQGRVVAKVGAEGVYGIGIREKGIGIAIKIEDGNPRALPPVALAVLEKLGFLGEQEKETLKQYRSPLVKNNRQEVVGVMETLF